MKVALKIVKFKRSAQQPTYHKILPILCFLWLVIISLNILWIRTTGKKFKLLELNTAAYSHPILQNLEKIFFWKEYRSPLQNYVIRPLQVCMTFKICCKPILNFDLFAKDFVEGMRIPNFSQSTRKNFYWRFVNTYDRNKYLITYNTW